jgi:hypothetical protein
MPTISKCIITTMTVGSFLAGLSSVHAASIDPAEGISQFIKSHDGDCFFVTVVTETETTAILEGYGSSVAPFERLDYEFRHQYGFAATIRAHIVAPEQCTAVNEMRNKRQSGAQ